MDPGPTELNWLNYRKAARILKQTIPGIKPQQIVGRLGYPIKDGQRISITSDGEGGIKQRNRTAHEARNRLYQKRRRIQTGKLSPQQLAESRSFKDKTRADGFEVDHFNEIAFIGEQLERLERSGGDVQAALQRLRDAGYALGDDPRNLQALSPDDNKLKYQQNQDLQNYLGSREALGQSPSARRPDLIVVGEDLSVKNTSFPGLPSLPKELLRTPPTSYMQPTALGGFDMSRLPKPSNTAHKVPAFTPPSVYDYKNGNGNGNGEPPSSGNGGNGGNYEEYLQPSPALQNIINDTFNYATSKKSASLAEAAIKAGVINLGRLALTLALR